MAVRPPSIDTNLDPALTSGTTSPTVASTQATINPDGTLASISNVPLTATTVISNTSFVVTGNTTTVDSGDNVVVVTTDRDVFITVNEDNFAQNFINNDVNNVGGSSGEVQYNKEGNFAGDSTFSFDDTTKVLSVDGVSTDTLLYANGNPWVFSSVSPGAPNNSIQFNDSGTFNGVPGVTYANGTFNLGNVNAVTLNGGSSGQVLTTDGNGVLSWNTPAASYSNSNVATYLPTYTGNISGDYANFTHDVVANVVDANFLYGDGSNITNVAYADSANSANFAGEAFSVSGSNVSGEVANAAFATSAANADFANNIYVEAVNNNYSYHVVLTTGPGDTTLHNDIDDSFQYNPADGILTVTRVDASYFVGDLAFAHGLPASNVTGLGNVATVNLNGNAQTFLTGNGTFANIVVPTVGNIASINLNGNANSVLAGDGNWVAQTGGGGGNLGNLQVNGTTLEIANGASETTLIIGNGPAGLIMNQDSGSDAYLRLSANTTGSQNYNEGVDYSSGTYINNGGSGQITLTGAPTIETFLDNLSFPGQIVSLIINGTDTVPYDGAGYGGGTVTLYTTTPPSVDPTVVTSIQFNIVYVNQFLLDNDEGDFGIYLGRENLNLISGLDVRIDAGDDFSVESNDGFDLRSRSTTGGIDIVTDYGNTNQTWSFSYNGNLTVPGNILVNGSASPAPYINGFSSITTFDGANLAGFVFDQSNLTLPGNSFSINYANGTQVPLGGGGGLPLSNGNSIIDIATLDGNITLDANGNIFTFGTDGNLTTPSNLVIGPFAGGGSSILQYDNILQIVGEGANAVTLMGWAANQSTPDSIAVIGMNTPYANGAANVIVAVGNNATTVNYWTFDNTGDLTIPGAIIGDTPNNDGYLNWIGNSSGDGNGYTTLQLIPDSTLTGGDQYVILDPTAPGHIHVRAGGTIDNSFASIYLGGEQSYFMVPSGSSPSVYASAGGNTWTFGNDGNLQLPGNTVAINFANGSAAFGNIVSTNLDGNAGNVLYGNGVFAAAPGGGSYGDSNVKSYLGNFDGNILPSADVTYDLGSPTKRWNSLYLSSSTMYLGNVAISSNNVSNSLVVGSSQIASNGAISGNTISATNANIQNILSANIIGGNLAFAYGLPAANVSGLGNIATINTNGNASQVLYGNGTFAAPVAEASFSIQNTNFNASVGSRYGVDTSGGAVTATLPASPATGGAIFFADAGGAYASNNLTINPNGQTIMGASGNMTVSTNNQSFGIFFNGTTWRIYNAG
jgi:hypothetical protein